MLEDGERERDRRDRAACLGRQPPDEEKAELSLAKRRERRPHPVAASARLRQ